MLLNNNNYTNNSDTSSGVHTEGTFLMGGSQIMDEFKFFFGLCVTISIENPEQLHACLKLLHNLFDFFPCIP